MRLLGFTLGRDRLVLRHLRQPLFEALRIVIGFKLAGCGFELVELTLSHTVYPITNMAHSFIAYIDESGDDGLPGRYRQAGVAGGASNWLTIGAVVWRLSRDLDAVQWAKEIARQMPQQRRNRTLHFADMDHAQRIMAVNGIRRRAMRLDVRAVQGGAMLGKFTTDALMQVRRGSRRDFSVSKKVAFFTALAETANIQTAAKAAGVSAQTIWRHRRSDPEFRAAWAVAIEQGYADLEIRLQAIARFGKTIDSVSEGKGKDKRVRRTRSDVPSFGLRLLGGYRAEVAAGRLIDAPEVRTIDRGELVEKVRIALQIVSERRMAERVDADGEGGVTSPTDDGDHEA